MTRQSMMNQCVLSSRGSLESLNDLRECEMSFRTPQASAWSFTLVGRLSTPDTTISCQNFFTWPNWKYYLKSHGMKNRGAYEFFVARTLPPSAQDLWCQAWQRRGTGRTSRLIVKDFHPHFGSVNHDGEIHLDRFPGKTGVSSVFQPRLMDNSFQLFCPSSDHYKNDYFTIHCGKRICIPSIGSCFRGL